MRHLILEGPDGGGKTRLAEAILSKFPQLTMGKKASTSLKGPIHNLAAWTTTQFQVMDTALTPMVYDRHPVISEPIYGPIARGKAQPGFGPSRPNPWLSTARLNLYSRSFVIWCIPTLEQVHKAVADSRDMPGVTENISAIYAAYLHEMVQWGGPGIRYDFSSYSMWPDDSFDQLDLFPSAVKFVEEYGYMIKREVLFGVR